MAPLLAPKGVGAHVKGNRRSNGQTCRSRSGVPGVTAPDRFGPRKGTSHLLPIARLRDSETLVERPGTWEA
jgi:hypothetical protein